MSSEEGISTAGSDFVQPFLVVATDTRGRLIRLGPAIDSILEQHEYPEPVGNLLAEAVVLTATLASALKYEGVFTLQIKGDGPVSLLVADMTSDGNLRGYTQFDEERLKHDLEGVSDAQSMNTRLLLGEGHLAFTVDQGPDTDRYQGIVELEGERLDQCVAHYFKQSEQIDASLKVAVGRVGFPSKPDAWCAGGIMVQRLPDGQVEPGSDREEKWQRTRILMESVKDDELLDPGLDAGDVLFRLFHEDGVRVFRPTPLRAKCRCSMERVQRILDALDQEDAVPSETGDPITVTCEFCGKTYELSVPDNGANADAEPSISPE